MYLTTTHHEKESEKIHKAHHDHQVKSYMDGGWGSHIRSVSAGLKTMWPSVQGQSPSLTLNRSTVLKLH